MAHTIYIRDDVRELIDQNKPETWSLSDYLFFLAVAHDDMAPRERAQRQYDFQLWIKEYKEQTQDENG